MRHQIKLEQNYRSHSHILDTANELIKHNKTRLGKNLHTTQGAGEPVRVMECTGDLAEANWLVEEIKQLLRDGRDGDGSKGVAARSEVAVLYRSNAQSRVIETALFNAAMPYRVYGGLRFFERAEIKHALAYLRLLENQSQTLRQIIELVLDHSQLIEHYQTEREGADRVENLQELVNAAESFVTQEGFGKDAVALPVDEAMQSQADFAASQAASDGAAPNEETGETLSPLAAFLTHAALESGDNQAQAGQDAVQLMTVHAAKGLEFDCVFITGLEEGLFPHENSMSDFEGLEEERRLMYVAITRARKRLYLSHSQTRMLHGQTRYNIKSRFFDEMPEHTLKWLSPQTGLPSQAMWGAQPRAGFFGTTPSVVPQRAAPQATGPNAWVRSGLQVFHTKFGEGTVVSVEGLGDDARAQVKFNRHGVKWLALSVAKLTQV